MRVGYFLPQIGPVAAPHALVRVAQQAEALGYDSLWVADRVLYPLAPRTPYPETPDGLLPPAYKVVFDPVQTLTFVAAHTSRIALGTCVLNMPFYNPVLLARQLTTLDVLSGGRLQVGLGQGWSKDEFAAVGASFHGRGRRANEFLQVLKAIWTTDPVEFHGEFFEIPHSIIQPKPVRTPHPPIWLGADAPAAMQRAATLADGWYPQYRTLDILAQGIDQYKTMAQAAGRDPAALDVLVYVGQLHGTAEENAATIEAMRALGVTEVIFDPTYDPEGASEDSFLRSMERMHRLL